MSILQENIEVVSGGNTLFSVFGFTGEIDETVNTSIRHFYPFIAPFIENKNVVKFKFLKNNADIDLFNQYKSYLGYEYYETLMVNKILATNESGYRDLLIKKLSNIIKLNNSLVIEQLKRIMKLYYDVEPIIKNDRIEYSIENKEMKKKNTLGEPSGLTINECIEKVEQLYKGHDNINSEIMENFAPSKIDDKLSDLQYNKEKIEAKAVLKSKKKSGAIKTKKKKTEKEN